VKGLRFGIVLNLVERRDFARHEISKMSFQVVLESRDNGRRSSQLMKRVVALPKVFFDFVKQNGEKTANNFKFIR
jgi:hypothetical protein